MCFFIAYQISGHLSQVKIFKIEWIYLGIWLYPQLREAIVESIKEVVSQQTKELRAIGYSVEVEYGDRTGVHNENLKDNNFRICIDWAEFPVEESDESDIINEEQQAQVRRVEYELNESESKSVYKKASVDDRVAQSQSELKELPKKKKTWWERLING